MGANMLAATAGQFDWSGLVSNVAGAAIGAIAAFIFALWLARLESDRQRRERLLEARETNFLATNAAVDACAQNIEELLSLKGQWAIPLMKDVDTLSAPLNSGNPAAIVAVAGTLKTFFMEMQTGSYPALPPSDRFAFVLDQVPYMTSFVHRAATSVEQVNQTINLRNDMLRRWADVGRNTASEGDMIYFFTMLSGYGRALSTHIDDALFFNHLLHDQCYYIGLKRFSRPTFRHVVLPQGKAEMVPPHDHLPGFRERLVTFGFPKIDLADDAAK